jgi:hypothetical protein
MTDVKPAQESQPREWPADANLTLSGRLREQDSIDWIELKKRDVVLFGATFISMQPIMLTFRGSKSNKHNFAIIGSNRTLSTLNFYAPKIGKVEGISTFDVRAYLYHIYVVLLAGSSPEVVAGGRAAYDKYVNSNPYDAIYCIFQTNGQSFNYKLSTLVNDDVINSLKKTVEAGSGGLDPRAFVKRKREEYIEYGNQVESKTSSKEEKQEQQQPIEVPESDSGEKKRAKKKKADTEVAPKKKPKKKQEEDDRKLAIEVKYDPQACDILGKTLVDGIAMIFDINREDMPVFASGVLDLAQALRESRNKQIKG